MEFLQTDWWLFAFSILGMIAHILKKNVKGESFIDIKNYFTYNPKSTILSSNCNCCWLCYLYGTVKSNDWTRK